MWEKIKAKTNKLTPAQVIVGYYLLAVSISAMLLSLPMARKAEAPWSFIDSIFTAVSAVSVTGLSTVNVSETFTTFGIFILILVLQVGGIGIMTIGTFFWLIFRKRIGFRERRLIMVDQNQISFAGLVKLLKQLVVIFIGIEVVGSLILGTYFLHYFTDWKEAYLQGIFASVSAMTNAGFDITGASMKPFATDYFVQFILMVLIILGAIGFPVLVEVKNFLLHRRETDRPVFSLFTKITTYMYFVLVIVGMALFLLFEYNGIVKEHVWHQSILYSLFQSVSARSGGLVTIDITELSEATQFLLSGLMFIGASPSSVGGGIRTTTFALNLLFLYNFAKGNPSIKLFHREIYEQDVRKALLVFLFATMICFSSVLALTFTEEHSLMAIIFEVTSAFGTSGMSMGITADLSIFGKIVIMLLMFIGRVGILSFVFMIGGKEKKENYHFPKERIIIG
ncbi:TrkH family potassium uptake protein [Fervidibacillus albus]|uniref:TrkH family potassium uptake protein n=1 Tax=Fervidibacillus albus TaxID=2980026 RepID=A0A9E8LXB5_9BACI|nr:TrkH family potassium uptake protein [Fervidibacillus albus]WAA11284.1 TrkH family potassium uptake protein [Fervidibacillus albus]